MHDVTGVSMGYDHGMNIPGGGPVVGPDDRRRVLC